MKRLLVLILIMSLYLFLAGCDCYEDRYRPDNRPPAVPTGFYSVTGDEEVRLYWDHNTEPDLDGYRIYWNDSASGWFEYLAFTRQTYYIDRDVFNGETYFYAISAVDYDGNESDLTYEDVFDTPRPEGMNQLYSMMGDEWDQEHAGWDFSDMRIRHWLDGRTDMYYEYLWDEDEHEEYHYLNVDGDEVKIQEWGYVDDLDEINWAPDDGWHNDEWVLLDEDRAYVLKINNPGNETHYAKIRIQQLNPGLMKFEWAYQVDPFNHELTIEESPPVAVDAVNIK